MRKRIMYPNDDRMPQRSELSDLMYDDSRFNSAGGIDNIPVDSASQGHAYLGTAGPNALTGNELFWPSYRPYEPELAPPVRYERLTPPPPTPFLEPDPEPARYEDCLMTQALFDWSMRNLPESPPFPSDDWI
jgi:hypothetical protein